MNAETGNTDDREHIVSAVVGRLALRYPQAPRKRIADVVDDEYEALDGGRIRTYIPTLVEHGARDRLHREFARRPGLS
ncbi:three-helix bundle dimerization domain-containing protein [Arthrobacter sp. NPDC058097]|uniref:three-helix bundle dimerization domain-containing protein n=1 Tax=Arthrobacter sp. NPDC058097 TaxID=3346340 RepID=UPI0036DC089D